jgi:branched-subunit amino acid ABC-type transport system permease component
MDWNQLRDFALLGLGQGALIAGIALGVVLTFRGSGIINLGTGAIAMVSGYTFWWVKSGKFGHVPTWSALVITLIVVLAMGALIEILAFRPLRTASPLAKLAASLGILLVAQAAIILAFNPDAKPEPTLLPNDTVSVLGTHIPEDRYILTGIVIFASLALAALYRWSPFGLATRAASENEQSAMLAGLSPNALSMANTLLASVMAGSMGVLAASFVSLDTNTLPLQIVPALAAALFARFTSFGIACAAGLLIGISESEIVYISNRPTGFGWFPQVGDIPLPGTQQLLVFILIVIAMFWRGASLPGRGELIEKRLPFVPRPENLLRSAAIGSAACVAALIFLPWDFRNALVNSMLGALICLSLVVITGFVGQISVVQLALAGISGFTLSHMATDHGVGFPWAPLIGAIAATVVGLLTGVSALRVRGVSLAVVTLAAAVAIEQFVFANNTWGGGFSGSPVPDPKVFGFDFGSNATSFRGFSLSGFHLDPNAPSAIFGFFVLIMTVSLCLLVGNLRRSSLGQRMLAVRSNERAAAAAGINVRNVKLAAFGIGSFIAGVAGGMYGYNFNSVSSMRFNALTALGLIAFAYVGGITMVSGAIFAGLISTEALFPYAFEKWFGISGTYALLVGGLALIFNLVVYPEGVAGAGYKKKQQKLRQQRLNPGQKTGLAALLERRRGGVPPAGAGA